MDFDQLRQKMVTGQIKARGISDQKVLDAFLNVARHFFVPAQNQAQAYQDHPLPIGCEQTISQPIIVAIMTEALDLNGDERVLEVGTGSGYQTVILTELAKWVVSVERHQRLLDMAREVLNLLSCKNVELHLAKETLGWPEGAPYDAIMVTAGAPNVPQQLISQLKNRGRMIIPVGPKFQQELVLVVRNGDEFTRTNLGACRFVPLIGDDAWGDDQAL